MCKQDFASDVTINTPHSYFSTDIVAHGVLCDAAFTAYTLVQRQLLFIEIPMYAAYI
jgi:hypothetical protein